MGRLMGLRPPIGSLITLIEWLDWAPYELSFAAEMAHTDGSNMFHPNSEMQEISFLGAGIWNSPALLGTNVKMTSLAALRIHGFKVALGLF